jgi:abortive infection bacteriophage resistance protein
MKKYEKPPLTLQQQLNHIKYQYKIECQNDELVLFYLKHYNYYRLRGYWLYFEEKNIKATFEDVINFYNFDNEVRLLFIKYLELIEISIKSNFTYILTNKYENSHIILDKDLFKNEKYFNDGIKKLQKSFSNSNELFATHYKKNYQETLPPLWVCVEFMTFGELSKWINNLNDKDTKLIAKEYNIKSVEVFRSFLYHLTEIRNKCAHHSRIWNQKFSHKFEIPNKFKESFDENNYKLSHTLLVMKLLLKPVIKDNFVKEVIELAGNHKIPLNEMGLNQLNIKELK